MKYVDYHLDITPGIIALDEEIRLDWLKDGEYFQVCRTPSGQIILERIDPLVAFTKGFPVNVSPETGVK